jgi:peroxiredoxin Q/BCP
MASPPVLGATWSIPSCPAGAVEYAHAMSLTVGDRAPEFTLPDQDGKPVTLKELLADGSVLVLFFYPKDDTAGCTAEACSFRDEYEVLVEAGAQVAGVSSDDVDSHRRFAAKYGLKFRLLADRGGALRRQFGVPKSFLGLVDGRVTYVIDPTGVIRHVFDSQVRPTRHVKEALAAVQRLER